MAIPDPLITESIQQSSYYPKYLEMVAENTKKTPQEREEGNDPDLELANDNEFWETHQEREKRIDDAAWNGLLSLALDPAFLPHRRTSSSFPDRSVKEEKNY
ncbi:hypothetical protein Tco_1102132 [Tanacetum coccineum]